MWRMGAWCLGSSGDLEFRRDAFRPRPHAAARSPARHPERGGRGDARHRRRGQKRNPSPPGHRGRLRDDRDPARREATIREGRLQGHPHRHRARHGDSPRRRRVLRGDDAARGHRDGWATRGRALRARLRRRCAAPRLHDQRPLRGPRRAGPRLCRRTCRPCGQARAFHRRSGNAHPRGLPAHPALLPLPRRICRGSARRGRA